MNGIAVLVALSAMGVDYGWQPTSNGQLEYIIQIEPSLIEGLKSGEEIVSEIHPDARGVRRFRIRVGNGQVPREGHLANNTAPRSLTTTNPSGFGTQPAENNWVAPRTIPTGLGSQFRPDGFLNLPPPPPLLGADGMNSILVRPGRETTPDATAPSGILPPDVGNVNPRGQLPLGPPPTTDAAPTSTWPTREIAPPSNSRGVFPPTSVDSPESPGNSVLPPAPETPPVRPIPSPSTDSRPPYPIRVGDTGIMPPGFEFESESAHANGDRNLLAEVTNTPDVASQKPTIDEETAEKLEAKPWKPLVLTSMALFASLAANFYLAWVALGIYRRYRDMVDQLHQAQASLT